MTGFQNITPNPKVVVNLSRISDPATRDVILALLRIIQELEQQVATVVNNNAATSSGGAVDKVLVYTE